MQSCGWIQDSTSWSDFEYGHLVQGPFQFASYLRSSSGSWGFLSWPSEKTSEKRCCTVSWDQALSLNYCLVCISRLWELSLTEFQLMSGLPKLVIWKVITFCSWGWKFDRTLRELTWISWIIESLHLSQFSLLRLRRYSMKLCNP